MSTNKIYIRKVGKKRIKPDTTDIKFEDLKYYINLAKIMIKSHAGKRRRGMIKEMLSNEDAVSMIAHEIMMADWQFNGKGDLNGFRKSRIQYAIKTYLSSKAKDFNKNYREFSIYNKPEGSEKNYADNIKDNRRPVGSIEEIENNKKIKEKLKSLRDKKIISNSAFDYIDRKFFMDMTPRQIAEELKVSRYAVHKTIKSACERIRPYFKELI